MSQATTQSISTKDVVDTTLYLSSVKKSSSISSIELIHSLAPRCGSNYLASQAIANTINKGLLRQSGFSVTVVKPLS